MIDAKKCKGPIYLADQGIEVCEACGGCLCCDFERVDHAGAERRCVIGAKGRCVVRAHADRPCATGGVA